MLSLISILCYRLPRSVLHHIVEIDFIAVREHISIARVVNISLIIRRSLFRLSSTITPDASLVGVLPLHTIRVNVAVFAARHAIHADSFFFERAVVIFVSPRYAAVFVFIVVLSDSLYDGFLVFLDLGSFGRVRSRLGWFLVADDLLTRWRGWFVGLSVYLLTDWLTNVLLGFFFVVFFG